MLDKTRPVDEQRKKNKQVKKNLVNKKYSPGWVGGKSILSTGDFSQKTNHQYYLYQVDPIGNIQMTKVKCNY